MLLCLVVKVVTFIHFDIKANFRITTVLKLLESLLVMGYYQSVVASWLLMCYRLAVN